MTKLNQVIAIEKGIKSRAMSELTELYKVAQKPELFSGFSKTYQKKDEEGEDLPSENKRVQFSTDELLASASRSLTELMDVTARKDWTNCMAESSVVVDGVVILRDVPVTYLLFLEKQLTDLRTFFSSLPVLDEAENWKMDVNSGLYKSEATQTHRTKKIQKPIVLYPATPEHAAQTQLITEDIIAGYWNQIKQSGAMPKPARQDLVERVEKLLRAVKEAREQANMMDEVDIPSVGEAVFGYLLNTSD